MRSVTVRFTGGPVAGEVRDLPAEPDGRPPARWVLSASGPGAPTDDPSDPVGGVAPTGGGDHLYERTRVDGYGVWTMSFVRSDPLGVTE